MSIHVSPATGEKKERALRILFRDLLPDEQTEQIGEVLAAEQRGDLVLEQLYLAEEHGDAVGTCLSLVQKDRSAFIWPPVVVHSGDWERVGSVLLEKIYQQQREQGVLYTQAMLEPEALDEQSLMEKNQFEPLAKLYFMECGLDAGEAATPKLKVDSEYHSRTLAELKDSSPFAQIIERTYEETLDVPAFNLLRTGEESLDSHRQNGPFDPALWFLYDIDDEPAGLILLREYADDDKWEVAYMGVVPERRGTGLGLVMLQESLNRARAKNRAAMFLAVDSRNHYALEIYHRIGFRRTSTKQVLIRR